MVYSDREDKLNLSDTASKARKQKEENCDFARWRYQNPSLGKRRGDITPEVAIKKELVAFDG